MAAQERKRPWYLALALLGALGLGSMGACDGWKTISLYRDPIDPTLAGQGIADEADRAAVVERVTAYLGALDAAKARGWPLAVAALILGSAMIVFAMRAIGGSSGARSALVQLVVAQAGLCGTAWWLMRDVSAAELRVRSAMATAEMRGQDRAHADDMGRATNAIGRAFEPVALVLRTLGSALVVVALTRRRSRAFFDAGAEAVEER